MSWNPVLNLFLEIKEYGKQHLSDIWAYREMEEYSSCLTYWACDNSYYQDILKGIRLNEHEDLLLIRYDNYFKLFANEADGSKSKFDYKNFWFMYDGLYRECRSVVIDIRNDCLVLTPFKKFFNIDEFPETSIEEVRKRIEQASCVEFSDKLDGSMQSARYYNGQYVMAGSQAINKEQSWRLEDGYKMLTDNHKQMLRDNPDITFIFEYLSKEDRHVVLYHVEGLFLIGMRNVNTGREASYKEILAMADKYKIPTTKVFDKTLDDIMNSLDDCPSNEAEGFVLNIDGYKVKIKYNDYLGITKILMKLSSDAEVIKAVADGKEDDILSKIPEAYRKDFSMKIAYLYSYMDDMEEAANHYYQLAPKEDKKNFMLWIEKNVPGFLVSYVRQKYLGLPYDFLKKRQNSYVKMSRIKENHEKLTNNKK